MKNGCCASFDGSLMGPGQPSGPAGPRLRAMSAGDRWADMYFLLFGPAAVNLEDSSQFLQYQGASAGDPAAGRAHGARLAR